MANKENKLIKILIENNRKMNATQLAGQLDVSVRTIHNYINSINLQYGNVITATATGYHIDTMIVSKTFDTNKTSIPQNAQERATYILNRLIQSGTALDIYDLCDEIYVSTTTFQSLLGKMRRLTREYDLKLVVSSNTIAITGSENNKRRFLSSLIYDESNDSFTSLDALQTYFPEIDVYQMRDDLIEILHEHQYFINDYSLINLLLHMTIAIQRIQSGYVSNNCDFALNNIRLQERQLTEKVIERLSACYHIHFPASEQYEMALLLASRTSNLDYLSINKDNICQYIGEPCVELVNKLIDFITEEYQIKLDSPEFFVRFALHIHNLINRAGTNSFVKNPMTSDIQKTCPLIYDVSIQIAAIIMEHCNLFINKDEITYIAFHIGGALETQKELARRIGAILYCPNYYDMNSRLAQQITERIGSKISLNYIFTDSSKLNTVDEDTLLISTIHLYELNNIHYVNISPFLTNQDIVSINRAVDEMISSAAKKQFKNNLEQITSPDLFEVNSYFNNRDGVIHYLCNRLIDKGYANEDYEKDVLERENISQTSFGKQFSIPHTLKMKGKKTCMYILNSNETIVWGDDNVNLVIMLCFNPEDKKIFYDIFEPVSKILLDNTKLKTLLSCKDYQSFIENLVNFYE